MKILSLLFGAVMIYEMNVRVLAVKPDYSSRYSLIESISPRIILLDKQNKNYKDWLDLIGHGTSLLIKFKHSDQKENLGAYEITEITKR